MAAGAPIAFACALSAALVSGGCRQLLGIDDPTTTTQDAEVDVDARGVDAVADLSVNLGAAGDYVVLAKAGITGGGASVTGNLGISPAAASSVTGFALILDSSMTFSTSTQVIGRVYASSYAQPTPANLGTAVFAMEDAFREAAGRVPDFVEWNAGDIGGKALAPGVYRWSTGLSIQGNVSLAGSATDVWILQIAGALDIPADTAIVLTGGALPTNVFWHVSGAVTLGSMSHLEGVLLAVTAFTSGAGSSIKGRVLSQAAVAISGSTLVEPAP